MDDPGLFVQQSQQGSCRFQATARATAARRRSRSCPPGDALHMAHARTVTAGAYDLAPTIGNIIPQSPEDTVEADSGDAAFACRWFKPRLAWNPRGRLQTLCRTQEKV